MKSIIRDRVPVCERLAGLAEELAELTQAVLKLRRVYDQTNPTPVTEEEALEAFWEEIADVLLYLNTLDFPLCEVAEIINRKQKRWEDRLRKKEA